MKSILFIDDDRFVTTLYKARLESEGFATDTAHNGQEALEMLDQQTPNLLILDLNMPDFNGVEVLRLVRATPRLQHVPVIVFSSGYVRALVDEATQLGIHKVLTKSQCPPNKLIAEVKEALSKEVTPLSALAADAAGTPGNPAAVDLPALLNLFSASNDSAMQHAILLKIYKASLPCIKKALKADENTTQGRLGRALEKLMEDLYTHTEHITESTKNTLAAGIQKLCRSEINPVLESEQALKDILRSIDE